MPPERPRFAVVREDPALEAALIERSGARTALVVASGGCTALDLAARFPSLSVTAFDHSAAQLARLEAKREALARGDLGALGLGNASKDALHQDGEFEGLFRLLREGVRELIDPALAEPHRWPSSPYWPALFSALFSEPLLHAMFGPAATQHAAPGSYPAYFQRAFERGLAREDAASNYFLRHVFHGDYLPGVGPYYLQHPGRRVDIASILGPLPQDLGPYELISLSNVFDWSDDALVADWAARITATARRGTWIIVRQLNNTRDVRRFFAPAFAFDDALGDELLDRDRSLFYARIEVARRT